MKVHRVSSTITYSALVMVMLCATPTTAQPPSAALTVARGGVFPWVLTVYDRQGDAVRTVGEPVIDFVPRTIGAPPPGFSPDGTRLAAVKTLPGSLSTVIRVFDLATGASTEVRSGPAPRDPIWSPDGRDIAYYAYRRGVGALYRVASDGTGSEELLYTFPPGISDVHLSDWSPDGRFLAFDSSAVVWLLTLEGDRSAVELMREDFEVYGARFSPDGRWLAYNSDESGRNEVYVRAFDPSSGRFAPGGGKRQVSDQGSAGMATWRGDARELLYLAPDGAVMAVDLISTSPFRARPPRLLFRVPDEYPLPSPTRSEQDPDDDQYGRISPDGQRIVLQARMPPERQVIDVAADVLAQYAGTFVNEANGSRAVVTVEADQLMVQPSGGRSKFRLYAESETSFFDRQELEDVDIEFVRDAEGAVTHFVPYGFWGTAGPRWTRTTVTTQDTAEAPPQSRGGTFPVQLVVYDRQGNTLSAVPYDYGSGTRNGNSDRDLSPDGTEIFFFRSAIIDSGGQSEGLLYRRALTGAAREQLLYRLPPDTVDVFRPEVTPDGRFVVFQSAGVLWILSLEDERTPVELAREGFLVTGPRFSPDGRWLAYFSTETGKREVYVRAFDPASGRYAPGGPWRLSDGGAELPVQWRADGGELYYMASDRGVMAMEVTTTPVFALGAPKLLFRAPETIPVRADYLGIYGGDVGGFTRDGERFQFVVPVPPKHAIVTLAPEAMWKYTGTYVSRSDEREVVLEGDHLQVSYSIRNGVPYGAGPFTLLPGSERYFFETHAWDESEVEFFSDDAGAISHFLVYEGLNTRRWDRRQEGGLQ